MPEKIIIETNNAPKAIGPYSQAVQVGDIVYLSGQIALHPETMQLIQGGIDEQATQVFHNLQAICRQAGGDLSSIIKLTIYLIDLNQFDIVNEVMKRFFSYPFPARVTIGVAALPKSALIEIDGMMMA